MRVDGGGGDGGWMGGAWATAWMGDGISRQITGDG